MKKKNHQKGSLLFEDGNPCIRCKKVQGKTQLHGCPLAEAIDGDTSAQCNCCNVCYSKCALEV